MSVVLIVTMLVGWAVGCSETHYAEGDCFTLRGTQSQGEVMHVEGGSYGVVMKSSKAQKEWNVPKAQLEVDTRRRECARGH